MTKARRLAGWLRPSCPVLTAALNRTLDARTTREALIAWPTDASLLPCEREGLAVSCQLCALSRASARPTGVARMVPR